MDLYNKFDICYKLLVSRGNMQKYIFFDLDETLIDNKKAQNIACIYLYNYYDFKRVVSLEEFLKTWDELANYYYDLYTKKEISFEIQRINRIKDLFNKYNIEIKEKELDIFNVYLKVYEDNWCLFNDVLKLLDELLKNDYKIGIISNGELNQQIKKLEKTNIISYISSIITSSEYNFSKPDTRIFEIACKKNNINYDEMIYIGDDYKKDIVPCKYLGIKSFWLNRNNKKIENNIDNEINSLEELLELLITKKKKRGMYEKNNINR